MLIANKTKEVMIEKTFSGKRKGGLDSGVLISLIYNEKAFQEYTGVLKESLFNFTHEECVGGNSVRLEESEVFKVLIKKYKINENEAKAKIESFLKKYNIKVIDKNKANRNLVVYLYKEGKKKGIEVHPPDVWIIADFKSAGINLVYSNNKHFRELCNLLNISAPYFPTDERQTVDKEFFKIFDKRKFRKA